MSKAQHIRVLIAAAVVLAAPPQYAKAADITAEQSALVYDLLEHPSAPGGADPAILARALDKLKRDNLTGQSGRPNFRESGILENYGKALQLGSRAPNFASDIGHIRDIAARGNRTELEQAISDLWVKAGRKKPDAAALDPVIEAIYGAKGAEPEETVNNTLDRPDHHTGITHARAGGKLQVDVTARNDKGEDTERTVFQGVTETAPDPKTGELQRHIKLERACTSTPQTDAETLAKLDGDWTAQGDGHKWEISHSGEEVTLKDMRSGQSPLFYTGKYHLGHISAEHVMTAISDMEGNLPAQVRSQLVTRRISFRVSLEFCAGETGKLKGTWSSQHVTYNGMSLEIKRVHDPYDLALDLVRAGEEDEKVAQGAATGEMP